MSRVSHADKIRHRLTSGGKSNQYIDFSVQSNDTLTMDRTREINTDRYTRTHTDTHIYILSCHNCQSFCQLPTLRLPYRSRAIRWLRHRSAVHCAMLSTFQMKLCAPLQSLLFNYIGCYKRPQIMGKLGVWE